MIVCPVCSHSNDDLSVTCSSCSSYIQDRVPNLDLFSMVWMIIETPGQAFKRVLIAEHKNFVLFLSLFLGLSATFAMMWGKQTGNAFDNLFPLLLMGFGIGVLSAVPLFFILSGTLHIVLKMFRGHGRFNDTYAVTGWSLVPVMLATVFILPLELGTLGLLLFSSNPSAYEVKPVVMMVLGGMDVACVVWTLLLSASGNSMAHRVRFTTALAASVIALAVMTVLGTIVFSFII